MICETRPAIRAHLLPQSFVREIFHDPKWDEKHMIIHPESGVKFASNAGRFEKGILCAECDGVLGKYENSAFQLLKRLRHVKVGRKMDTQSIIDVGVYPFRVTVIDEFIKFACGVLWKYSSTPADDPAHIEIGDCRELFEGICWRETSVPESLDVFIERDLFSFAAFKDPYEVYYYCSPSVGRRGYRTFHDFAWFSVGGFTIYVKLNQPGASDFAPRRCWMRGKKTCHFNVAMRSIEVNSGIHESIGMTRDDLARLNKAIHSKYQTGDIL